MKPISRTKRWFFIAILVLAPYLVIEAIASTWAWFSWWDQSFGMTEDIRDTFVFDPLRGYRLTGTPAAAARITDGHVEYVGWFRGNNQGFPDRDDFGPERPPGGGLRLAVLGDSFTHAHYLGQNWPDRAEDLTRESGQPAQLLNFSLSYVGLANWWSILTKVIEPEKYDIDGVIFPVWESNLLRSFTTCSTPEPGPARSTFLFGRCRTWEPATFPKTAEEARAVRDMNMKQYLLPREEFERALQGEWPASAPRRFRPFILTTLGRSARALLRGGSQVPQGGETEAEFEAGRARLIEEMRHSLERLGVPVLVIHIPSRESLLRPEPASRLHFEKSREFARLLEATFIDGGQAFAGMSPRQLLTHFYRHDGHWNQKGSDHFAEFVVGQLGSFKARRASAATARNQRCQMRRPTATPRPRAESIAPISRTKRCFFVAILILVPYLAVESVATAWAWVSWWDQSFTVTEDTAATFAFDRVRGYRLGQTPARTARITNGRVEYLGAFRGNNQGFGDRDDFGPRRPQGAGPRVAVFGDSFSHAPYLGQNWPDRVEDLARARGEPLQLLNFSQWSTGLANWWSILTRVVEDENYEIDGMIFAVWDSDLLRGFTFYAAPEYDAPHHLLFGRCRTWDPSSFPTTEEAARPFLDRNTLQYLVTREEFEQTLQGVWPAPVPRHFRPVILTTLYRTARALFRRTPEETAETEGGFEEGRKRMVEDMRRFLAARRLPALVIHLPAREALLRPSATSSLHAAKARELARDLGAAFLDGGQVYDGKGPSEIRAHFYPYDGHWNQKGSDRFAELMMQHLATFRTGRQVSTPLSREGRASPEPRQAFPNGGNP